MSGRDPHSLRAHADDYFDWMRLQNFAASTVQDRGYILAQFIGWCRDRGLAHSTDITRPILDAYRRYLFLYRQRSGKPLTFGTQHTHLSALRAFFRWLTRESDVLYNPASELELPKRGRRLPRHVLNVRQMEQVLAQPDLATVFGLRDRAILETLYSTGMRAGELCRLELGHVDADRGVVFILEGKGNKDRLVPSESERCAGSASTSTTSGPSCCAPSTSRRSS